MSTDGSFGTGSSSDAQQSLQSFWPRVMEEIRNLTVKDFRVQELPLARIKKIMKLDEDVKMISAEAPVLFAKAAQIFITELTLRAWIHTEDNKRRTLQRNDIAMAITKFDQFDFLIDIVPRDELKPPKRQEEVRQAVTPAEPVQYYFTLAQQPAAVQVQGQQQGQQTTTSTTTIQPGQIIIAQPQQGQVGEGQQVQIVQAQPQGQSQQAQSGTGQTMQVMQQIITNTGEIQQIPHVEEPQSVLEETPFPSLLPASEIQQNTEPRTHHESRVPGKHTLCGFTELQSLVYSLLLSVLLSFCSSFILSPLNLLPILVQLVLPSGSSFHSAVC
ncbi:nuclear transcription factor Y subunit gamma isoform X2 [Phasianus colchicus]|uniref:nuclear transcription factor Y subunit gamma isoform X2 n=1 Tax=Phasianus colchicus TaxID=9054 RepID=UPI00129D868C|nr:nuclear transcription factor Y subunit gamma isoform X2 [Phasianus colchicus]